MSNTKNTSSRAISVERLLRHHTRIDLLLAMDFMTGHADVRSSMILDLTPDQVIISQTSPSLGNSWLKQKLEASVVHFDLVTREVTRWGWVATVIDMNDRYKLHSEEGPAQFVPIIALGHPKQSDLVKSNVRQAYRLDVGLLDSNVTVDVNPELAPVSLMNFSAGGLMLSTTMPTSYTLGLELSFKVTFQTEADLPAKYFGGKAFIVRLEVDEDRMMANLGLKFKELSSEAQRALPKILQYYMLEEQRNRKEHHERRQSL